MLSAGPTPRTPLDRWSFSIEGLVREPISWTWDIVPGAPQPGVDGRHQLRDEVDQARHALARRQRRYAVRARRPRSQPPPSRSRGPMAGTRRTCRSRTSSTARRSLPSSTTADPSRPSMAVRLASSCPAGTSGRAPNGCAACASSRNRRARILGVARLPQSRRPVARRALQRRLGTFDDGRPDLLATRDRDRDPRRDAHGPLVLAPRALLERTSSGPARGPAADRRGRLQRRAELLDRVRAGARRRGRDHGRAHRRRRGLAVPPRRRGRRRPGRAARSDRRLLRLGGRRWADRCSWSPAARASCR